MDILSLGRRALVAAIVATAALAPLSVEAQSRHAGGAGYGHRGGYGHGHGHYGGAYWGPAVVRGGLVIGIGLGSYSYGYPGYPGYPGYWGYPGYTLVEPPPAYFPGPPQALPPLAATPSQSSADVPVIYPRNGQSTAQTEADRLACNRWATTLPSAMTDASVFNRATAACMDGHGYSLR